MMIETLTPRRTAEILRDCGMKTSEETIRLGLQQGVFPFGECILQENGRKVCYIYKQLLERWIQERTTGGAN